MARSAFETDASKWALSSPEPGVSEHSGKGQLVSAVSDHMGPDATSLFSHFVTAAHENGNGQPVNKHIPVFQQAIYKSRQWLESVGVCQSLD